MTDQTARPDLGVDTTLTSFVAELTTERAALVNLHWQRGIVGVDDGFFADRFAEPIARTGVLDRTVDLVTAARKHQWEIFHVVICNPPNLVVNNPLLKHALESGSLLCGTQDIEVINELSPHDGEHLLEHHRVSAFAGTELAAMLVHRGIQTVLVTGISTHVAVEGTIREGVDRGFNMVLVEDCCMAPSEDLHENATARMRLLATEVITSETLLSAGGPLSLGKM